MQPQISEDGLLFKQQFDLLSNNTPEYEFTVPGTGEVIILSNRYEFVPEGVPTPISVVHKDNLV